MLKHKKKFFNRIKSEKKSYFEPARLLHTYCVRCTFSKLLKEIAADFETKAPSDPDPLSVLHPNDHFVFQKTPQCFGNELQERVCSRRTKTSLERFKGCRDCEEKCSSLRLLTASHLICRTQCAQGLKVAYIEQKCTETV